MIAFTQEQLKDELQSTKFITDNLKNLMLDIIVFPNKFDIKNSQEKQCLADGFIYVDDMLTHKYAEKKEYLLLKMQLMGDASGKTWFVVDLISNSFKDGVVFDENKSLEK